MSGEEKNIGSINCFCCGNLAEVRQAARRGRHFYILCGECGTLQGTKAPFQTRIWNEATFTASNVIKPNNVTDTAEAKQELIIAKQEPSPRPEPKQSADFNPLEAEETEQGEPYPEPERTGNKGLAALVVVGVAAIVGGLIS